MQLVDALVLLGGDVDEHRVAAVLLGHQVVLGELLADLVGVGPLLVHLVDRDHDRHAGRLGVVERLDRLGHHAVVGRDHEDRDVGHLRTTGTHGGERLVARGVDERDGTVDALVRGVHLVGTDVLRDPAGLARDDVRLADGVEELGLSVVDVTHDGDDRRTRRQVVVALGLELGVQVDVEGPEQLAVLLLGRHHLDDVAELDREGAERVLVERLGRRGHLTEVEQHGDQRGGVGVDLVGEVVQRRAVAQPDDGLAVAAGNLHATQRGGLHLLELLTLRTLRLAATDGTTARATEGTLRAAATGTTGTTAAATGTTGETAAATGCTAGSATRRTTGTTGVATTGTAGTAACATATGTGRTLARTTDAAGRAARHHARVGARTAGTGTTGTRTTGTLARRSRGSTLGGRRTTVTVARTRHALRRRERVVAGTRTAGAVGARTLTLAGHALRGCERVVAGTCGGRGRLTRSGTDGSTGRSGRGGAAAAGCGGRSRSGGRSRTRRGRSGRSSRSGCSRARGLDDGCGSRGRAPARDARVPWVLLLRARTFPHCLRGTRRAACERPGARWSTMPTGRTHPWCSAWS